LAEALEKIIFSKHLKNSTLKNECKNFKKIFILMDTNTKKNCWHLIEKEFSAESVYTFTLRAGEKYKNLQTLEEIIAWLLKNDAEKNNLLINLGGGVVSDIGAFASSIYKRGIKYANIPTSLMAMVDAAIGGKNGVDFNHIKNAVGTFSHPEFIFICHVFLETPDKRNFNNGLAEVFKHKILQGKCSEFLEVNLSRKHFIFEEIKNSVNFKSEVVNKDRRDKGIRNILNLGHTLGHALESYLLKKDKNILHGEAISAGIICELYVSTVLYNYPKSELKNVEHLFFSYFKKIEIPKYQSLKKYLLNDKKNKNGKIKLSLMKSIDEAVYDVEVDEEIIKKSLAYYKSLN
jgi:3-dehydroquinate synthase